MLRKLTVAVAAALTRGYVDTTVSAAGRSFSARVYYPATTAGSGQPVAVGRFPVIAFGHGFLQGVSKYHSTMSHLATWGFIVVAPTSQGGFSPNHSAFADDLNAALTWTVAQDTTGGFHCGFMDSGSISRATQLSLSKRLLTEWFLRHLAGDLSYDDAVWGTAAQNDPQVTFEGVR